MPDSLGTPPIAGLERAVPGVTSRAHSPGTMSPTPIPPPGYSPSAFRAAQLPLAVATWLSLTRRYLHGLLTCSSAVTWFAQRFAASRLACTSSDGSSDLT